MVIVEGPDGAGKTTLVQRIMQDWEGEFELIPKQVTNDAVATTPIGAYIEGELGKGFGMRLYDRFALISSPLYVMLPDPTFREQMLDFSWLRAQHMKMAKIDPVIIWCLPSIDTVMANVLSDESSKVMWPFAEQIYWNYHAYAARVYNSAHMVYDYQSPDSGNQLLRLASLLRWAKARVEKGRV